MSNPKRDFVLDVTMGKIPGYAPALLLGQRIDQSIAEGKKTIWDHDDSIVFLSAGTDLFASSSSASDTAPVFLIACGLDDDFRVKSTTTALTGQTQVPIGNFRVVQNATIVIQGAIGDVYIAEADTLTAGVPDTSAKVQSKILAGKNITHNGFFTVPAGFSAITMAIRATTDSANKSAKVDTQITPNGQPTLVTVTYSVSQSFPQFLFPAPISATTFLGDLTPVLPEKTTISFAADVDTNNTDVFFGVDFILVQNEEFFR